MNRNKNLYSYIMWLIFAAFTGTLFIFGAIPFIHTIGVRGSDYDYYIVASGILLIIIISILLAILFRRILPVYSKPAVKMWTAIGLITGIAAIASFRVLVFDGIVSSINSAAIIDTYYSGSLIKEGIVNSYELTSVQGIYNSIISVVFSLFGNSGTGLYIGEQIMMLVAFFLMYFAVKEFCGAFEGFVFLIVVSVLPVFVIHGDYYSSYICNYLLFAIGFFLIAGVYRFADKRILNFVLVFICSAYIGFLAAYEDEGVALFAFAIVVLISNSQCKLYFRIIGSLIIAVIGSLFFVITEGLDNILILDWNGLLNTISSVCYSRFVGVFDEKKFISLSYETYLIYILIACLIYVVMYLMNKKESVRHIILLLAILIGLYCYLPFNNNYSFRLIIISLFAVIGGSGLSMMVGNKRDKALLTNYDDLSIEDLDAEEPKAETELNAVDAIEEEVESKAEENKVDKEPEEVKVVKADVLLEEAKIELFENPLPLPKKSAKRDLEYDYDVPEDMMHYDIEVFDEL